MRKVLFTLVVLLILFFSAGQVSAYTYDGEISPKVVETWEIVDVLPPSNGLVIAIHKNPDQLHPIKYIVVVVNMSQRTISGYAYYRNDELLAFRYNSLSDNYDQVEFTPNFQNQIDQFLKPHFKPKTDTSFTKPI